MKIALAIHNHQPVGNFEEIFEDAYQRAYWPFLQIFARHQRLKLNLHNSGPVWEFVARSHPEYMELVARLVGEGRLELLTGAYYEPILAAISEEDGVGQIGKLTSFLKTSFGCESRGLWLAERVWEPHLPRALARAGVKYCLVDGEGLRAAGKRDEELTGYFVTEHLGSPVAVVPINRSLRWAIPFEPVANVMRLLGQHHSKNPDGLVLFADDGEKFGLWPTTQETVYQKGWLEDFFTALDRFSTLVEPVTLGRALETTRPSGRVYLPTTAYSELMGWALPPRANRKLDRLVNKLRFEGLWDRYEGFVHGTLWRSCLARYPEANRMHQRALRTSRALRASPEPSVAALDLLWKGQCNCAYWHGVYAGLYLPHLREAVYSNLIRAEAELDRGREPGWTYLEMVDLDCDGTPEVIASSAALNAFFSLVGGAMFELDFKPRAANLADTLARWPEAYHPKDGEEYDGYPRDSFLDHFYAPGTSLVQALDSGDFAQGLYEHHPVPAAQRTAFKLVRHGAIAHGESTHPVTVEKEFEIDREACRITARYRVTNTGPVQLATRFGVELNWALQSGDAPSDRFVLVDGQTPVERRLGARAEHPGARELVAHDRWRKLAMKMQWSRPAVLWRYPVETTSRTFARTETIFQSLCLIPVWDLELPIGGTFAVDLVLTVEATS